ncbi:MAG TPA: hypothetical protein VGQ99_06650 [Tepidisphaeraceae bacterium]|jgi:hypothetical protein|nr:hypothetical protein [Tepidisphaeraceae bacterium]
MPLPKDEMVLQVDGLIRVNPSVSLRGRCKQFIASRTWSTPQIFYAEQEEPDATKEQGKKIWSITLALGLDHVPATKADWFADVKSLIGFIHPIARETKSEFLVEFRLSSKLWYSCTFQTIDEKPIDETDFTATRLILENEINTHKKRPWWRKLIGR